LLRTFLEWSDVRGYSATTDGRRRDLMVFVRWAHGCGVSSWTNVDKHVIHDFQRHQYGATRELANGEQAPLAVRTQVERLLALQALFRFLARHDHVPANPASDLERPRVKQTCPSTR
jgi:integrase/recombinase XerD